VGEAHRELCEAALSLHLWLSELSLWQAGSFLCMGNDVEKQFGKTLNYPVH